MSWRDDEFEWWLRKTRKLFEEIDKIFEEMLREPFELEGRKEGKSRIVGPYFYGFSVTIGPDGVPKIREWGNIKPGVIRPRISETIEPFTDVIEEADHIKVIMDIPGVEKDKINVQATEDTIEVSATNRDRKYYKLVRLPAKIIPETAKATYKNGVLTITLEKKEKKGAKKGYNIKVE